MCGLLMLFNDDVGMQNTFIAMGFSFFSLVLTIWGFLLVQAMNAIKTLLNTYLSCSFPRRFAKANHLPMDVTNTIRGANHQKR